MTRTGWILFALMSVIWGLPYLMIKVAVGGVSVPVLLLTRTAVGAAILLPMALRHVQWTVLRRHWRPLLAFALLEVVGPWALLSDAERRLSSSLTGLLIAATPIVGAVALAVLGERSGAKQWLGLVIGFGGVAVLAAPNLSGGDAWSIVEVMLTAVGYAIAPIIAARKLQEVPTIVTIVVTLVFCSLVYLPFAVATWPQQVPATDVLFALGGLALICTALAFMLFFRLIREVGPSRAVVITYVNPVIAVAAGVLLLNEPLTVATVIAFVLILGGSILATSKVSRTAEEKAIAATKVD